MPEIKEILEQRQATHGDYKEVANTAQLLKAVVHSHPKFDGLPDTMCESLDLICSKISRILNGNPFEPDHWNDIAGYATLVPKNLA